MATSDFLHNFNIPRRELFRPCFRSSGLRPTEIQVWRLEDQLNNGDNPAQSDFIL